MNERYDVHSGRDDPAYWEALEHRIHDVIRREAKAHIDKDRRPRLDAEAWLAARSKAVSLLAVAAAAAAVIVVSQLRTPSKLGNNDQSLWASALVSRGAGLAAVSLTVSESPSIASLMIDDYEPVNERPGAGR